MMSVPSFIAGRDIKGAFATGDHATATTTITEAVAPDMNVDIVAALSALKVVLCTLPGIETKALIRLDEARDEAAKSEPKREEVKSLVAQATNYAREATGFIEAADKLTGPLQHIAAWAGSTWQSWAPTLGLG
jgi:hypothetical protein